MNIALLLNSEDGNSTGGEDSDNSRPSSPSSLDSEDDMGDNRTEEMRGGSFNSQHPSAWPADSDPCTWEQFAQRKKLVARQYVGKCVYTQIHADGSRTTYTGKQAVIRFFHACMPSPTQTHNMPPTPLEDQNQTLPTKLTRCVTHSLSLRAGLCFGETVTGVTLPVSLTH